MLQEFINKNFYRLFIFTLIFGVIFYDTIGFAYTDEMCSLLLFVLFLKYVFTTPHWEVNKMFLTTTAIFIFYLCYSIYIDSNSKAGILTDFIIQYKPYLGGFCVYAIKPTLSKAQKKMICDICLILAVYLLGVAIAYVINNKTIYYTIGHMSRLATAVSIVGLLYLYCSDYTKKDKIIFILIMIIGLFSGRSKFYGFFVICATMILFIKPSFKLNLKTILLGGIAGSIVLLFTYDKLNLYFINGGDYMDSTNESIQDAVARAAFYYHAIDVLNDYFPFGPGFATYGTYASGVYYSDLYSQYGMDTIFGLTKNNCKFVADTYYPALTQFGYIGVILFFSFWTNLTIKALKIHHLAHKETILIVAIIIFFMIECTTDATITHNRGLFMMMLLGLLFSDVRNKKNKIVLHSN